MCEIALRFQWLWPTPFNLKTQQPEPSQPYVPSSSCCSRPRRLRFTFVAIHLRSLVGNGLHFGCGILHLRLAFSAIILHSLTTTGTNVRMRETQKDKKREDSVSSKSLSLSFTAKRSVLSCLLYHFSKKEGRGKLGENMQDALREFVFPPGTECISHIMGSSSLS